MTHWANTYIGAPWVEGAEGPDAYDCYGLLRTVMQTHYGIEMPVVELDRGNVLAVVRAIRRHEENANWEPLAKPEDGCLVKMFRAGDPDHVGIWIDADGGGVLHCNQVDGVAFHGAIDLPMLGWRNIQYYRRRT